jgi:hypothetical protein
VEIHLASASATSMGFDLSLTANRTYYTPSFTAQPQSQSVNAGVEALLGASVQGSQPLSFQWMFNGSAIPNATNLVLDLQNLQPYQAGAYVLTTSNPGGTATSQTAVLTVVLVDSDGDGMPDYWEMANGFDPNVRDASGDFDGDGMSNLQEYLAGTDPKNASSVLKLAISRTSANQLALQFQTAANHAYMIQYRASLSSGAWSTLTNIPSSTVSRTITVPVIPGNASQFYRICVP